MVNVEICNETAYDCRHNVKGTECADIKHFDDKLSIQVQRMPTTTKFLSRDLSKLSINIPQQTVSSALPLQN